MKKKNKLQLGELKVKSFLTTLTKQEENKIKGGEESAGTIVCTADTCGVPNISEILTVLCCPATQ